VTEVALIGEHMGYKYSKANESSYLKIDIYLISPNTNPFLHHGLQNSNVLCLY